MTSFIDGGAEDSLSVLPELVEGAHLDGSVSSSAFSATWAPQQQLGAETMEGLSSAGNSVASAALSDALAALLHGLTGVVGDDALVNAPGLSVAVHGLAGVTGDDAAGSAPALAVGLLLAAVYLFSAPGIVAGLVDTLLLAPVDAVLNPAVRAGDVKILKRIADGTFGAVYTGTYQGRDAIVKKYKRSVTGADDLQSLEEHFNRRCRRGPLLRRGCAPYIGSYADADEPPVLVWSARGTMSLADLLESKDFVSTTAETLKIGTGGGSYAAQTNRVARECMRQILSAAAALHAAGIVHRDVKPSNMVAMQSTLGPPRLRLVDFGAAIDFRTGLGYDPKSGLCDPGYCPPEITVLPETTPAPPVAVVAAALSPLLWVSGRPDLYDAYSAGIVLLQLCIPALRRRNSVQPAGNFQRQLAACDFDLSRWRTESAGGVYDFEALDFGGGLAWKLACALVCRRNALQRGRLSCGQALLHPWLVLPL